MVAVSRHRGSLETVLRPPFALVRDVVLILDVRDHVDVLGGLPVDARDQEPRVDPAGRAPIGPPKGMSEIERAADAAFIAGMSGSFVWSAERTVMMIWTSFL